MELKDKILKILSLEGSKSQWRNNHGSHQWILANEVALIVMGERLNKAKNCGCLNDLFIMLKSLSTEKIKLKTIHMNNKFKLRETALIFIAGSHYSSKNITDEKSIEILTKFPAKIADFISYPENWEELTAKEVSAIVEEKVIEEEEAFILFDSDLEDLDEKELRIICTNIANRTEGLRKLNHKALKPKMIEYILENK